MPDTAQVATNLHRLASVLGRVADRKLLDTYGFGMSQFKILWMLHKHREGVLQTTIASWLSQTEAAISRQIGLLEGEGLIEKQTDPKNRRNHTILLSAEGEKFATAAMKVLMREYKPLFGVLTAEQQDELNTCLEKVFFAACKALPENSYMKGHGWKK